MPAYSDAIFRVRDLEDAKRIILTPADVGTEVRWANETPFLRDRMLAIYSPGASLLDFGCGIGRLAKAWLDASRGGRVLGVDLSVEMRQLAPGYVASERFACCAPEYLSALVADGMRFDGAVACWIIQHVRDATQEIGRLHAALKTGARLLVVNGLKRAVPTDQGWIDDGFDVAAALAARFQVESVGRLPEFATSELISQQTFIGVYRRA